MGTVTFFTTVLLGVQVGEGGLVYGAGGFKADGELVLGERGFGFLEEDAAG